MKSHHYLNLIKAGCDKAEHGYLAESVLATAVILPSNYDNTNLNDSKRLSRKKRDTLRQAITNDAATWTMGEVIPREIDEISILRASFLAMHHTLDQLTTRPQTIIMDGNRFMPYYDLSYTTIVKGDGKYQDTAATSVLAKIFWDDYMDRLAQEYPQCGWQSNMGYPTRKHREATRVYGITPCHRRLLNPLDSVELSLDL